MDASEAYGMQTFDLALLKLFQEGRITEEEALKNADSANNLRLKMKQKDGFQSTTEFELAPEPGEENKIEDEGESENQDDDEYFQDLDDIPIEELLKEE